MQFLLKLIIFGLLIISFNGCAFLEVFRVHNLDSVEILNKTTNKIFKTKITEKERAQSFAFRGKIPKNNNHPNILFLKGYESYLQMSGICLVPIIPFLVDSENYFKIVPDRQWLYRKHNGGNRIFEIIDSYFLFDDTKVTNVCDRIYYTDAYPLKDKNGIIVYDKENNTTEVTISKEEQGIKCYFPDSPNAVLYLTLKYTVTNEEFLLKMHISTDWLLVYAPLELPVL